MEIFGSLPYASLSIMIISISLVMVVVIGGVTLLRRSRGPAPTPRAPVAEAHTPADPPRRVQPLQTRADEEYELARRIDELDRAITALSQELEMTVESQEEERSALTVLARSESRPADLVPQIVELRQRGLGAAAIAKRLRLSEEQLRLLLRVALRRTSEKVAGE